MIRWITCPVVAGVVAFATPATAAPPDPFTVQFEFAAGAATGGCTFPVLVQATGKAKNIVKPGGGVIGVSANTTATATNTVTGKSVRYSINGTFHNEPAQPNGNVVTKATGRNFLGDPIAGIVVTSGNFSFTSASDGSNVVPLSGKGNITDVCAALA